MSLATTFRAILRFFRMSTPTNLHLILFPPKETPSNLYLSLQPMAGGANGAATRRTLQGYTASKVTCYKQSHLPQHEYVLVEVRGFNNEQVGILRFERRPSSTARDNHTTSASTLSTSLSKDKVLASDTVKSISSPNKADSDLKTIHFAPGLRPTLLDLYILLFIINKHSEFYNLLREQCYWFADIFSSVLESFYEPKTIKEKREWAILDEGQAIFVANSPNSDTSPDEQDSTRGTWCRLPVLSLLGGDKKAVTKTLVDELKQHREEFAAFIQEAEREVKEVEDTKKRADEQGRLAKEEKKRADEQERLAKEEKKRADEQERLAKEEKKRADEQEMLVKEGKKREEEQERLVKEGRKRADEQERLVKEGKKREEEQERLAKEEKKRAEEEIAEVRRQAREDKKRADEELANMRRLLREQQA